MTVHGAKGLEAKKVILIDHTTTRPEGAHPPRLLIAPIVDAPPDATALIWGVAKDKDAGPMTEARTRAIEAARDEYRRLLYVGLTRAEERLIVCGAKGVNKASEGCWHDLVLSALRPLSEEEDHDEGKLWRFRKGVPAVSDGGSRETEKRIALPSWLTADAPPSTPLVAILRPSDTIDEEPHRLRSGDEREFARLRGTLAHRLLQSLPDIPAERRRKAADDYLARTGGKLPTDERTRLAEEVMRVLGSTRFSDLFGPGSRAEVPVVGELTLGNRTVLISGQVDRLSVAETAVLIGDFKTNRSAPRRIEEVPSSYVLQLALYRAILARLYPERLLRAAIIWTEVPDLMELSAEVLDRALADHVAARAP
jgi:ATP-dependent helicase/nuclease subunit A